MEAGLKNVRGNAGEAKQSAKQNSRPRNDWRSACVRPPDWRPAYPPLFRQSTSHRNCSRLNREQKKDFGCSLPAADQNAGASGEAPANSKRLRWLERPTSSFCCSLENRSKIFFCSRSRHLTSCSIPGLAQMFPCTRATKTPEAPGAVSSKFIVGDRPDASRRPYLGIWLAV